MSVVFQIVEAIVSAVDIVEASHKLNRCTQRLRLLHVDESVFEQTLLDTEPEVRPGPRAVGCSECLSSACIMLLLLLVLFLLCGAVGVRECVCGAGGGGGKRAYSV